MNQSEIQSKLGLQDKTFEEADHNPLRLVLSEEFNNPSTGGDYRKRAIDRCLKAKIGFDSESNTVYDLAKMCLKIVNPVTGNEMKITGGGGSGSMFSITAVDQETGDQISLNIPVNAISVSFKDNE